MKKNKMIQFFHESQKQKQEHLNKVGVKMESSPKVINSPKSSSGKEDEKPKGKEGSASSAKKPRKSKNENENENALSQEQKDLAKNNIKKFLKDFPGIPKKANSSSENIPNPNNPKKAKNNKEEEKVEKEEIKSDEDAKNKELLNSDSEKKVNKTKGKKTIEENKLDKKASKRNLKNSQIDKDSNLNNNINNINNNKLSKDSNKELKGGKEISQDQKGKDQKGSKLALADEKDNKKRSQSKNEGIQKYLKKDKQKEEEKHSMNINNKNSNSKTKPKESSNNNNNNNNKAVKKEDEKAHPKSQSIEEEMSNSNQEKMKDNKSINQNLKHKIPKKNLKSKNNENLNPDQNQNEFLLVSSDEEDEKKGQIESDQTPILLNKIISQNEFNDNDSNFNNLRIQKQQLMKKEDREIFVGNEINQIKKKYYQYDKEEVYLNDDETKESIPWLEEFGETIERAGPKKYIWTKLNPKKTKEYRSKTVKDEKLKKDMKILKSKGQITYEDDEGNSINLYSCEITAGNKKENLEFKYATSKLNISKNEIIKYVTIYPEGTFKYKLEGKQTAELIAMKINRSTFMEIGNEKSNLINHCYIDFSKSSPNTVVTLTNETKPTPNFPEKGSVVLILKYEKK